MDWALFRDLEESHSLCFGQRSCQLDVALNPVNLSFSALSRSSQQESRSLAW